MPQEDPPKEKDPEQPETGRKLITGFIKTASISAAKSAAKDHVGLAYEPQATAAGDGEVQLRGLASAG